MRVTLIVICCFFSLFIPALLVGPVFASTAELAHYDTSQFPPPLENYHDNEMGLEATLVNRIKNNPFNLLATLIFFSAIGHSFLTSKFLVIAHQREAKHRIKIDLGLAFRNTIDTKPQKSLPSRSKSKGGFQ